jgi:hypothetical protein
VNEKPSAMCPVLQEGRWSKMQNFG